MTTKSTKGEVISKLERHYHTQATNCRNTKMMYGAQWKTSYIRDTALQPYQAKTETFEIPLPDGTRQVDVTVELTYEISNPDNKAPIHKVERRVSLDQ